MDTKHTPGPWKAIDPTGQTCLHIKAVDGVILATVFTAGHNHNDPANARLIAAAPKMLKGHERIETEAAWEDETTIEQLRRKLDNCSEEAQAAIAAATE